MATKTEWDTIRRAISNRHFAHKVNKRHVYLVSSWQGTRIDLYASGVTYFAITKRGIIDLGDVSNVIYLAGQGRGTLEGKAANLLFAYMQGNGTFNWQKQDLD